MTGLGLYASAMASGTGAYFVGRGVLRYVDYHRNAIKGERADNVVRLLQPYEREMSADDECIDLNDAAVATVPAGGHLHAV